MERGLLSGERLRGIGCAALIFITILSIPLVILALMFAEDYLFNTENIADACEKMGVMHLFEEFIDNMKGDP